ncbi:CaiB/BaiF CoA transferase family protein [Sphingosinithalassobacter portus]|uniref:CaiB/BaiF CoA transferase family protein n=1 Tax=Stakelama portus TaxID=2676234 RepID=UPI000D6E3CC7|nr:CoA transferase [Sphingosinithalassobacter portus]
MTAAQQQGQQQRSDSRALPLSGVRILTLEQYGAAPYGTLFLAQLGAEVIKIEPPRGGDTARAMGPHFTREGESLFFQTFNANKRSITLDIRESEGRQVFERLVKSADAVANNLRGDLAAKLRVTHADLAGVNPAIVCAHLSAYGRDNERAAWPGYDYLMQAEAGFMSVTGEPDAPPTRFGLSVVDFMTGMMMATGLVSALLMARETGKGSDVDVDLLSAAVHQTSYPAVWYLNAGATTGRTAHSGHPSVTPSQLYPTADGHIFIMAQLPKFWDRLIAIIGRPDLAQDPRFAAPAARTENRDALNAELNAALQQRTTAQWLEEMQGQLPVSPVHDLAGALDSPFLRTTGMIAQASVSPDETLALLANPIRIDGARLPVSAGPRLGQDSDTLLAELGFDREQVAKLRKAGIV